MAWQVVVHGEATGALVEEDTAAVGRPPLRASLVLEGIFAGEEAEGGSWKLKLVPEAVVAAGAGVAEGRLLLCAQVLAMPPPGEEEAGEGRWHG